MWGGGYILPGDGPGLGSPAWIWAWLYDLVGGINCMTANVLNVSYLMLPFTPMLETLVGSH